MPLEIERKFLVSGDGWRQGACVYLCQGYLAREPQRTVRIRIAGDDAWLTIKGISTGASRPEFEYNIPVADARQLLELCEKPLVEKYRRTFLFDGNTWEVDEFLGDNAGLVVAEIELSAENQTFGRPAWLGREVTDDVRYFNANLSRNPYSTWKHCTI
jgi:adenylate cyclase